MSHNSSTGIKIVAPADWTLRPAASWNRSEGAVAEAAPAAAPARPRSMLINSAAPYVDILEETPGHYSHVHKHTEPEILVVLAGSMMFNGEMVGTGSMIYIPADEEYWHSTTDESCVVGVIRPVERGYLVGSTQLQSASPGPPPASPAASRVAGPYRVDFVQGQRCLWCTCGRSVRQPFCDGKSHLATASKPMPYRSEETRSVTLCGCKRTCNPPYCDGSHKHVHAPLS